MKKMIVFGLVILCAVAALASPPCNTPLFPKPTLNYLGATDGNPGYFDIWFGVGNAAQYDNTLFVASPTLPACGLNKNASRTWLDVYTDSGAYIYGYCALSQNTQLQKLAFPWKKSTPLPKGFFIRMRDRKCSRVVQSNTHYGF